MVLDGKNGQVDGPAGGRDVLLVIDVQNGVVADAWDRDGVVGRIARVIDRARADGTPVVYVQHEEDQYMEPGMDTWQLDARIAPQDGEPVVAKRYTDAFVDTFLPETLANLNAGHLIIAGAQTDACIRSTLHRAMGLGYDVTLVSDCHTTDDKAWDGMSITGEQIVKHFNLAIQFTEYPGQIVQVLPHADVELNRSATAR